MTLEPHIHRSRSASPAAQLHLEQGVRRFASEPYYLPVGDEIEIHSRCHASDLPGRFLIRGEETVWVDGPLTTAARLGAICYLDEIVEARQDTIVVIHPLTDDR